MGSALAVKDLSVRYGRGGVLAVDRVSFEVASGARTILMGRSGCGKSTILKAVGGFLAASAGSVLVDGALVKAPGPDRFVVWQDQEQLLPWKSVLANVAYPLEMRGQRDARSVAREWLNKVGLARALGQYPHELSGGMKMRVAIARGFAAGPKVLLMDEPFSALDALTREKMQDLLMRLQEETRLTLLFVTHDLSEAVRLGQRVVVLSSHPGRVAGVFEPSPATATVTMQEIRGLIFQRGELE
ncbi:MAG: ABC transporter ATP-binding protein [Bdellovibrionota bacterium]